MDLQDQGVINSGCSRHMTGNMSYHTDYEEIDGGYVAFGGNPKGGKITRKCTIKIDDFSRFTWVFFLATKDETSGILKSFITGIENLVDHKVNVIRCDNGTEFKNKDMNQFYEMKGILRQYSVAKTPQQNRVAKRRNRTLIEPARTLCPVTILNIIDHLRKFDGKADEGFFVGYSINSKAFRVFNSRTRIVKENLHVQFSEKTPNTVQKHVMMQSSQNDGFKPSSDDGKKVDKDSRNSESIDQEKDDNVNSTNNVNAASTNKVNVVDNGAEADMNNLDTTIQVSPIPTTRIHKDHPLEQIIGDLSSAPQTRRMTKNLEEHVEPKKVIQALQDPSWIEAMQDELLQFKLQKVWTLVDLPDRKRAIGYTQEEGIDYDEVFAPIARIEAIRLFL
ncbi:putative ribonuclease H-like domain-containing protein [Tanacetum coccineum]